MGACGQPITAPLCRSFLCTLFPCSSVSPSHGLQPFSLLQSGSFTCCSACQENLLQHGLSTGHSSFRKHPPTRAWGPAQAAVWLSALVWSSPWAAGTTCLTVVLSIGCRGIIDMLAVVEVHFITGAEVFNTCSRHNTLYLHCLVLHSSSLTAEFRSSSGNLNTS